MWRSGFNLVPCIVVQHLVSVINNWILLREQVSVLGPLLFLIFTLMMLQAYVILQAPILACLLMICCCTDALTPRRMSNTFKKIVTPHAAGSRTINLPWTHQSASIWLLPASGNKPAPPPSYWRVPHSNVLIPSNIFYLQTSPGQVESVCTKARKFLGLLYRCFHNNTGTNTLLELYTTLVRPHLEYAALFEILLQPIT